MSAPPTDDRFTKIAFATMTSLVTAGVVGIFSMSIQMAHLDERVANWTKTVTDRIDYATQRIDKITQEQRETDRRIGVLEGQRNTRNN